MFLSVFNDELFTDVEKALPKLKKWCCTHVDLRDGINNKGIEFQTTEELTALKQQLDSLGLKVGALETSLCKIHLPDAQTRSREAEKLEGIIRASEILDCRLVRAFNYWQPYEHQDQRGQLGPRFDEPGVTDV